MKALTAALSLILTVSVLLIGSACAKPAPAPTPAPATKAAPAPAPKPAAPAPAPAAKSDPLTRIIEGAKKEGAVSVNLVASYTPAVVVQKLRSNVMQKYGVDLDIKVSASPDFASVLAKAIMEYKTGTAATYDLIALGSDQLPLGVKEGVFEKVDWKSLFPAGMPPGLVPESPLLNAGPIFNSSSTGLVYNPSRVPVDQVPKTISALADPKWKGKLGIINHSNYWVRWAFVLGKDKTLDTLRTLLKTKPILLEIVPMNNRYLVGEVDLAFTSTAFVASNPLKGVPTAFRSLDFLEVRDYQITVVKNARNPNAARLLAVYLTSPDGVKFSAEQVQRGNHRYPGNVEYDFMAQAQKEGIPVHTLDNNPKLLDFILTAEYDQWQKEIELIIKQGG